MSSNTVYQNSVNIPTTWTTDSATTISTGSTTGDTIWIDGSNLGGTWDNSGWSTGPVTITTSSVPWWDPNMIGSLYVNNDKILCLLDEKGEEIELINLKTGKEINSLFKLMAKKLLSK